MTNTKKSQKIITLAGGGLVGALLALVLAKKGYHVEVFESRPDLRKVNISAGKSINLALANRGIKPLADLGLMHDINKMLIPMRGRMVHIEGKTPSLQAYGQTENEVIYSISRGDLNSLLISQAEQTGNVHFNFEQRLTNINFDKKQLNLTMNNENIVHQFDRLIGTDGANSVVRKAILGQSKSSNSNKKHDENNEKFLDHSYKELVIKADVNGQHKIDKNALHIWPRGNFMIIALPNLDGSFTVTLFLPSNSTPAKKNSFASLNSPQQLTQFFQQYFSTLTPLLDNLSHDFFKNPTGRLATIKCAPWHLADKALILGDAAHAIVPFHGQGMNCGFEDCDLINQLLPNKDQLPNDFNWQTFFQLIEQQRKVNTDAIADMAIENYQEMRNSVMYADYLLKKQCAFKIQQWFPTRFSPRYSMVMFEHRPFREVFELGEKHKLLLTKLCKKINSIEELNKIMVVPLLDEYQL